MSILVEGPNRGGEEELQELRISWERRTGLGGANFFCLNPFGPSRIFLPKLMAFPISTPLITAIEASAEMCWLHLPALFGLNFRRQIISDVGSVIAISLTC